MRVIVFGSGKMGSVIAWDLARNEKVEAVGIFDVHQQALADTRDWINSEKISIHSGRIDHAKKIVDLAKGYDVAVGALAGRMSSNRLIEAVLSAGIHLVDIQGVYYRKPDLSDTDGLNIPVGIPAREYGELIHQKAKDRGLTLLGCTGFAPGLTNATLGEGIRQMDKAETAIARVGGIPAREVAGNYLMKYMITWSWARAVEACTGKVKVRLNGRLVDADVMGEYERFRFTKLGQDEELEAYLTPGLDSLLYTRPELKDCYEKTVRWPGFRDAIVTLDKCGLLDRRPISFKGAEIAPIDFTTVVMEPKVKARQGDPDISIMWNTVTGIKKDRRIKTDYYMWVEADSELGISSMGRATGFPASVAAVMVAEGKIDKKGFLSPEDAIEGKVYQEFLAELRERGIEILEVTSPAE